MIDSRADFEEWFKSRPDCYAHSLRRCGAGYEIYETSLVQLMWEAWQAAIGVMP